MNMYLLLMFLLFRSIRMLVFSTLIVLYSYNVYVFAVLVVWVMYM